MFLVLTQENVFTTEDVLEELKKESSCKIDEEKYIRTRLFDMLVGDWDRNEKKYSWVQRKRFFSYLLRAHTIRQRASIF